MTGDWQALLDEGSYVEVAGTNVHHFDMGEGRPLVLVHGGGLTSSAPLNWGAVLNRFAEHCRVVALDQPGFGFTEPRGERDYYPSERASFLVEFIETLGLDDVAVVGNSTGSTIASHAALDRPDLLSHVGLVNGGTIVREFGSPSPRTTVEEPTRESVREELERFQEDYFTETKYHPFWREITEAKVDWMYDLKQRNWEYNNERDRAIRATAHDYNKHLAYEGTPVVRQPENFDVPVLLAWSTKPYYSISYYPDSDRDRDHGDPDATYEFFKQLDEAQMHIWQHSKHHTQTDRAPEFVDVVTSFISH
jgi:pimeloyl-ACP methyl ester carboxylesterase